MCVMVEPGMEMAGTPLTEAEREALDYLAEEVLAQQTGEVQAFLLQTSILDRLSGASVGSVSVAGFYEVRFEYRCRDTQRPLFTVLLRNLTSPHQFAAEPLLFQSLHQCLDVGFQAFPVRLRRHPIHATGCVFVQIRPAA